VDGYQFSDPACGGGAGINRSLDGSDITACEHRDVSGANVLFANQGHNRGLDHGISRLDGADEAAGFNHSKRVCGHDFESVNRRNASILNSIGPIRYHPSVMMLQTLTRQRAVLSAGLSVAVILAGCGSSDDGPPVASVSMTLSRPASALGSPIDMTYRFELAPGATLDGDYRVFVHLLDSDGVNRWTDDHDPPVKTSAWKAGETIEYTRTSFVPVVPYLGEGTVRVGLYRVDAPGIRAPLSGPEPEGRSYKVATLQLLPQSDNIFIVLRSGAHPAEFAPENPSREWFWTKGDYIASFKNPKKDAVLYLDFDSRPDLFNEPQVVTVYLGDESVESFVADNINPLLRRIPLNADQLGSVDMAELRISVDRTFSPVGGQDTRELGIRVYHVFVGPS